MSVNTYGIYILGNKVYEEDSSYKNLQELERFKDNVYSHLIDNLKPEFKFIKESVEDGDEDVDIPFKERDFTEFELVNVIYSFMDAAVERDKLRE